LKRGRDEEKRGRETERDGGSWEDSVSIAPLTDTSMLKSGGGFLFPNFFFNMQKNVNMMPRA